MRSSRRWIVGVDIGGTNLVVGLVPAEGGDPVALRTRSSSSRRGADATVADVARLVEAAVEETLDVHGGDRRDVLGVGVGAPGPLDLRAGIVRTAPNLGWTDYPLRDEVARAVGLPVNLDNDANCATYGEWWRGAGRGFRLMVGITVGTGIGGGVIVDGQLVHGGSGSAGEIGHTTIDFTGRRCACGNYGCLEAYASGPNIAARAREGLEAGAESVLMDLVDGNPARITAITVYEALVLGDAYANEVMLETAKILGAGVANVVNTLNPDAVVIVGGVTRAGDHLFKPLRSEVRRRAFRSSWEACRILPGELPETAGVVGAAGLFRARAAAGSQ